MKIKSEAMVWRKKERSRIMVVKLIGNKGNR